jgi:glycosyltransferase involved in cell wall biosynthesis
MITQPPVAALFAASASGLAALERSILALEGQSVLAGTRVGLVGVGNFSAAERARLEELATRIDEARRGPVASMGDGGGFLALVEEARRRLPDADIVLLEPGIALPFAWDARLAKAARAAPKIAAASALCESGSMFSLLDADAADRASDAALIDRTVFCLGLRSYYEVPGLNSSCVFLRRDALDAVLREPVVGTSPAALARHLRSRGWHCVLCDFIHVGRPDVAPSLPQADRFDEEAFVQHHPLGVLRRALNDGIRQGLPAVSTPALDARPVHLHVMHFWGGGLDRWVRDFGGADRDATHMLFASYRIGEAGGQRLVLYADPAARIPIRVWDIAQPIRSTASASLEYRRILDQIIEEFDVEAIVVSSLIGHSLEALTRPVRTLVTCHDYYPVCQAVNPRFGRTCERCTLEDLRACAQGNPLNSIFKDQSSEDWHAMRRLFVDHLLAGKIEMVVPTPSMVSVLRGLDPRLEGVPIHVIGHGIDFAPEKLPYPPRGAGERLRLAVLGRQSIHKGMVLLREVSAELSQVADVTLVGGGRNGLELAEQCGWKAIERYEPGELPQRLRSLAPHAGLLASVVPETFSYTLSELWALGIPPVVSSLGSFRDRVVDGEDGFLFEPDASGLLSVVRRLHAQPELLHRVARNLEARVPGRSTSDMVADYRALLPAAARAPARFRVGIGRHTALTEPYRHLDEAYAHLRGAYAQSEQAYAQVRSAYEQTRAELGDLRAALDHWLGEFTALHLSRRWWNLPRALRLVRQLPFRIASTRPKSGSPNP